MRHNTTERNTFLNLTFIFMQSTIADKVHKSMSKNQAKLDRKRKL